MINKFYSIDPERVTWRSVAPTMRRKYYDYDDYYFDPASHHKIDSDYGIFHVAEDADGDLVVSVSPENMPEFLQMFEEETPKGYIQAEYEIFEPIWANGLDFLTIDTLGHLSEAPAFGSFAYLPDWIAAVKSACHDYPDWLHPDYASIDWERSKLWTAIDYYQISSPLDEIKDKGSAVFYLAR